MPIYEYYCPDCHGRFQHLAKTIDAAPPPCPRCAHTGVQRMVSSVNVIHRSAHHERALRQESEQIDAENPRAVAQFLQESGRLADAEGVYGSQAYQELLYRRAEGASEADVADLVDNLAAEMQDSDASRMAGAMVFSDQVENRMQAEGPPEDHDHATDGARGKASSRSADNLGWG